MNDRNVYYFGFKVVIFRFPLKHPDTYNSYTQKYKMDLVFYKKKNYQSKNL